jgi:hypothetical protein
MPSSPNPFISSEEPSTSRSVLLDYYTPQPSVQTPKPPPPDLDPSLLAPRGSLGPSNSEIIHFRPGKRRKGKDEDGEDIVIEEPGEEVIIGARYFTPSPEDQSKFLREVLFPLQFPPEVAPKILNHVSLSLAMRRRQADGTNSDSYENLGREVENNNNLSFLGRRTLRFQLSTFFYNLANVVEERMEEREEEYLDQPDIVLPASMSAETLHQDQISNTWLSRTNIEQILDDQRLGYLVGPTFRLKPGSGSATQFMGWMQNVG